MCHRHTTIPPRYCYTASLTRATSARSAQGALGATFKDTRHGVTVARVVDGSQAGAIGVELEIGDTLVAVGGADVRGMGEKKVSSLLKKSVRPMECIFHRRVFDLIEGDEGEHIASLAEA